MWRPKDDSKRCLRIDRGAVPDEALTELVRPVGRIEAIYREIAQRMGQLCIYADRHEIDATRLQPGHP